MLTATLSLQGLKSLSKTSIVTCVPLGTMEISLLATGATQPIFITATAVSKAPETVSKAGKISVSIP